MQEAIRRAGPKFKGVVFWHEAPFAFGANLKEVTAAIKEGQFDLLELIADSKVSNVPQVRQGAGLVLLVVSVTSVQRARCSEVPAGSLTRASMDCTTH